MITDFDRFSADEIRSNLILSKELLRGLIDSCTKHDFTFFSYMRAYFSLCDAISAFDRVQSNQSK